MASCSDQPTPNPDNSDRSELICRGFEVKKTQCDTPSRAVIDTIFKSFCPLLENSLDLISLATVAPIENSQLQFRDWTSDDARHYENPLPPSLLWFGQLLDTFNDADSLSVP